VLPPTLPSGHRRVGTPSRGPHEAAWHSTADPEPAPAAEPAPAGGEPAPPAEEPELPPEPETLESGGPREPGLDSTVAEPAPTPGLEPPETEPPETEPPGEPGLEPGAAGDPGSAVAPGPELGAGLLVLVQPARSTRQSQSRRARMRGT